MKFRTLESVTHVASRFATVDGLRTHYIEAGQGPALVLVHGGGAGADAWGNWYSCIEEYAVNFRVIAVDMPGFGKTEKPDPKKFEYSQATRNRHLAAFIEQLGVGPVYLIGNSMGGATALGVALRRPDLVSKLVLMGSAGLDISNPDPDVRKALTGYDFTREGMRRLMRVLAGPHHVIDEDLLTYRHGLTLSDESRRALSALRDNPKLTYPKEEIATVATPTLVVGGKEDKIAVLARTYGYLEVLENSWGFVLPHCGHWVMMEAPREFVAVTTAFFTTDMFRLAA